MKWSEEFFFDLLPLVFSYISLTQSYQSLRRAKGGGSWMCGESEMNFVWDVINPKETRKRIAKLLEVSFPSLSENRSIVSSFSFCLYIKWNQTRKRNNLHKFEIKCQRNRLKKMIKKWWETSFDGVEAKAASWMRVSMRGGGGRRILSHLMDGQWRRSHEVSIFHLLFTTTQRWKIDVNISANAIRIYFLISERP